MLRWLAEKARKATGFPPAPVPFTHPRYGVFEPLGFGLSQHKSVKIKWLGRRIDFAVESTEATEHCGSEVVEESFDTMDALLEDQAAWHEKAKIAVLRDMYPAWIKDWRDPLRHPMLTETDFWEKLRLKSITAGANGQMCFFFESKDRMFGDQMIDVFGNLEDGFKDAALAARI